MGCKALPFELWSLVCTFLSTNDLTRLACVSFTLLSVCRPIIYRSVILRNDNQNLSHIWKVLKIDGLSSAVRNVTLFTTWTPYTPSSTWLDFSLISEFRGLRSLTLIGSPFLHDHEQFRFLHTLKSLLFLKSLTFFPHYPTIFRAESLHIAGLECVSWPFHYYSYLEPQAISLLSASAATLTSITLPNYPAYSVQDNINQSRNTWKQFLSLRFPCLTSLSLGLLPAITHQNTSYTTNTPSLLTSFLRAHPLLRELFLACNLHPRYFSPLRMPHYSERLTGEGGLMAEDFLPSLRTFETHPANVTLMIRRYVKSLQELERLSLLYYCDFETRALADMVDALECGSSGFPSLNCLAVQLAGNLPLAGETEIVELIRRLGAYCPAVISFTGHIYKISPLGLARAFRPYSLLRSIEIPWTTLDTPGSDLTANHLIPLACACPHLSNIVIQPHQNQSSRCTLNRNNDGSLNSVTVDVFHRH